MLRTILVDDEIIILEELKDLLLENESIQIVGAYQNPQEALAALNDTKPDCAFLDIEMPEMKGTELAELIISRRPQMEIVFVTAYNNYAAEAYEINALDYLLKPIHPDRLQKSIQKLIKIKQSENTHLPTEVSIRSFGSFEVYSKGSAIKWGRSKSKELLAYMLQNEGKWIGKYRLCEELRPDDDPEQALQYIQVAIYTLRKNLKEAGCTQLEIHYADDRYKLIVGDVHWDLAEYRQTYEQYRKNGMKSAAEVAAKLYSGDYLEGEDWIWADLQREVYRNQFEQLKRTLL